MDEGTLWLEHRERLMRFVLSRGVQPDDAEDIVQEVLAKALAPGGGPGDSERLLPWLYQVVRNAIADHWRRRRPTEEVPEDLAQESTAPAHPDLLLSCLEPFLAQLDGDDARVLRLADADGLPQAAIAETLGLSVSGAKSRIQRARARVFEMYRQCCTVQLDRGGRLVDHEARACPESSGGCGESACDVKPAG